MSTHVDGENCPGCDTKLVQAHPTLVTWFKLMKLRFPTAHISCSWRSEVEQNRWVMEGKSKTPWPTSKHNVVDEGGNPRAEALDLFQCINGVGFFRNDFYKAIKNYSDSLCEYIRWGGDWDGDGKTEPGENDLPHFELRKC